MHSTLAIIPARGGSVGVPRKNLAKIDGLSLLARTVQAANQSNLVQMVVVSSDCDEILAEASRFGAFPLRRPANLSGNHVTSEDVLVHTLHELTRLGFTLPPITAFLQCTSPFTTALDIDQVIAGLFERSADSSFSAVEDHGFLWSEAEDGIAEGITHDARGPRLPRQLLRKRYRETGAVYAFRTAAFLSEPSRFCGRTVIVPLSGLAFEIDTPEDLALARVLSSSKMKHRVVQRNIQIVFSDFDGVHTDDGVWLDQDGKEAIYCSRADGFAADMLRAAGLELVIVSREQNHVVQQRAKKLRAVVRTGVMNKAAQIEACLHEYGLDWEQAAFIGNDVADVECMRRVGLSGAPSDAHPAALGVANIVTKARGGHGAFREFVEAIIVVNQSRPDSD